MLATLLAAVGLVAGGSPVPSKGYSSLANHVDAATFICIGRVTDIVEVRNPVEASNLLWKRETLPFARVAIERTLKGDRSLSVVFHEAWGTWSCDTTSAKVGERALFLLAPGWFAQHEAVRELVGPEPVLRNVGSGDGILRVGTSAQGPVVSCVGHPDVLRAEGARFQSSFAAVVRYVEELVEFAPETVAVRTCSGFANYGAEDEEHSFDLRILDDGRVRLAQALGPTERVSTFRLEPSSWSKLRNELGLLVRDERRTVGDQKDYYAPRRLALRIGDGTLEYREPREGGPPRDIAVREVLEAWALVRAAVPCEGCADHAEADRAWLQEAR